MNRRLFLGSLLAGFALDPERLLWERKKLISIPKPRLVSSFLNVGDVLNIEGRYRVNPRTRWLLPDLERLVVTAVVESPIDTSYYLRADMAVRIKRETSGVHVITKNVQTAKERILNDRRLRALAKNAHIFEPLKDPERLPK